MGSLGLVSKIKNANLRKFSVDRHGVHCGPFTGGQCGPVGTADYNCRLQNISRRHW